MTAVHVGPAPTPQATNSTNKPILHFRTEKELGAEMRPAIVSGIVTGYATVTYWSIFPCPWGESQRSLRR